MKNMKYKVLAADDEFWSRENIRNLIPWEEYSLEFLEPACDCLLYTSDAADEL